MEPEDQEELIRARETLRLELNTLYRTCRIYSVPGPLPIIGKLQSQIDEITELLESAEADDA